MKVKLFKVKSENKKDHYNYALWEGEPGVKGSTLRTADTLHELFKKYISHPLENGDATPESIGKYNLVDEYDDFNAFKNENLEHVL